jgi:hypothetical protein
MNLSTLGNYSLVLGAGGSSYGTATYTRNGITYSTTTGLFTVPMAGLYSVGAYYVLTLNGSSQTNNAYWQLNILHNGVSTGSGPVMPLLSPTYTSYSGNSVFDDVVCAAGDTLGAEVFGYNFSNAMATNSYVLTVKGLPN